MISHLKSYLHAAAGEVARAVFPPFCQYCLTLLSYDALLCQPCLNLVRPIVSWRLALTKKYCVSVHALSRYEDPLKQLIGHKFRANSTMSILLGRFMAQRMALHVYQPDYIVPVPLHWMRYIKRGYNQTELMAEEMGRILAVPVYRDIERSRHTHYQSSLPIEQRSDNVSGAFRLRTGQDTAKHLFRDKTIMIVDDLSTTGETLRAVARLFVPFRPRTIHAALVCRARV